MAEDMALQQVEWTIADPNIPTKVYIPELGGEFNRGASLSLGEARANSYRRYITMQGTPLSRDILAATEDPFFSHHGFLHGRFVEKSIKKYVSAIGGERFVSQPVLDALMLTPNTHDLDQLLTTLTNTRLPEGEGDLPVKEGHGLAAGVMVMAMAGDYARATQQNGETWEEAYQRAKKSTNLAAIMMFRHEYPSKFMDTFNPTNQPAYYEDSQGRRKLIRGHQLVKLFEADELDLTTLSPSQCLEILVYLKSPQGFLQKSHWGLFPEFENQYGSVLNAMAVDDNAIGKDLSQSERDELILASEILYRADMAHMVSPFTDAPPRTFEGQKSQERPLWVDQDPEVAFQCVLNDKKGDLDNDLQRLAWEFINIEAVSYESPLSELDYTQQFNKDHALLGILTLEAIAPYLLTGPEGVRKAIENLYKPRLANLEKKRLQIESETGYPLNGRCSEIEQRIVAQREHVISLILRKNIDHKGIEGRYSSDEVDNALLFLSKVKGHLVKMYGATESDLIAYQELIDAGQFPETQPTEFHDPIPIHHLTLVAEAA